MKMGSSATLISPYEGIDIPVSFDFRSAAFDAEKRKLEFRGLFLSEPPVRLSQFPSKIPAK